MKKRREKPRGPRVTSRYDPTAKPQRAHRADGPHDFITVLSSVSEGKYAVTPPSAEQVAAQAHEPVNVAGSFWLYHDYWVEFWDAHMYRPDETALLVKRAVLREEREIAQARQEVETLERFRDLPKQLAREMIPDEVRMFVWQRDGGQCVRCGGRERLEFDHIIPVADGGSSTERNVQLLCEPCNRSKGRSVS